jgi:hypothetical protein
MKNAPKIGTCYLLIADHSLLLRPNQDAWGQGWIDKNTYRLLPKSTETLTLYCEGKGSGGQTKSRIPARVILFSCPERNGEQWVAVIRADRQKGTSDPYVKAMTRRLNHPAWQDDDNEWRDNGTQWGDEKTTWPEYITAVLTCWRDGIVPARNTTPAPR